MKVRRLGAIAIGSNSVRMLTANLDETLSDPVRGRVETSLFLSMDEKKRFSEAGMERVAQAVRRLAEEAQEAGAQDLRLIATSAMRDADNRTELDFYVAATSPVLINRIISGEEEARLSFLAATSIPAREGLQGMVDIGGGSTEVALGSAAEGIQYTRSLQLGAARLLAKQEIVCPDTLQKARAIADQILREGLPHDLPRPHRWAMVGGTGTTLANMLRGAQATDVPEDGSPLHKAEVEQWLHRLAPLNLVERAQVPGLPEARVQIIVTGLCILLAVMDYLDIEVIHASLRNNLDGYLYRLYKSPQEDPDAPLD